MARQTKRAFSVALLLSGTALYIVAITTESWWLQASAVPGPKFIDFSIIFHWKGLHYRCLQIPPAKVPTCQPLKDVNMEDDWMKGTRYLMYIAVGLGSLEVAIVFLCLCFTRRFFMDYISLSSLITGIVATIGLSIYTQRNPTYRTIFFLYGYSYICGWLGVAFFLMSSLFALLSRLDSDGQSFLTNNDVPGKTKKLNA